MTWGWQIRDRGKGDGAGRQYKLTNVLKMVVSAVFKG